MARSAAIVANTNATAAAMNLLRSDALAAGQLQAHQQASPGLTVHVESGVAYIGNTQIIYAGGDTGTFTAPSTHPRIDLITIDTSGTLGTVTGTEATSPTAPAYPTNKIVVAQVTHAVGETIIYDNENQTAGQGYITDVRPFINYPVPSAPTATDNSALLFNTLYTNSSGRPQLHIVHVSMSVPTSGGTVVVSATRTGGNRAQIDRAVTVSGLSQDDSIVPIIFFVADGDGFQLTKSTSGGASGSIDTWYTITL